MNKDSRDNLVGKAVLLSISLCVLWLVGGFSMGLIWGLIATGGEGGHGAAAFVVCGILVGIAGGLAMAAYAYRLKVRRAPMTTKHSYQIALIAGLCVCMFLAYILLNEGKWGDFLTWLYLSAVYLAIATFLCFSIRLVANWDLRKTGNQLQ